MAISPELPDELFAVVTIDEDDLSGEFARFAAVYARWLYTRAELQGRVLSKTRALASESAACRERWLTVGVKMTVDDLKAKITLDPIVARLTKQLETLEAQDGELRAIIEALRAKKDMLVSLGAHQRALLGPLLGAQDGIDLSEKN